MKALTTIKRGVDKVMEWSCILILIAMTVLVTYQVITRYFFNRPSAISETAAQYLFVWMVAFGSAYVFGLREHLSITVIKDKLSPRNNMIIEILINLVLLAFSAGVLLIGGLQGALKQMGTVDAALQIPMGVIYIALPFCGAAIIFYVIYNTCLAVWEYRRDIAPTSRGDASTM